jgi:hypothetical protein
MHIALKAAFVQVLGKGAKRRQTLALPLLESLRERLAQIDERRSDRQTNCRTSPRLDLRLSVL